MSGYMKVSYKLQIIEGETEEEELVSRIKSCTNFSDLESLQMQTTCNSVYFTIVTERNKIPYCEVRTYLVGNLSEYRYRMLNFIVDCIQDITWDL